MSCHNWMSLKFLFYIYKFKGAHQNTGPFLIWQNWEFLLLIMKKREINRSRSVMEWWVVRMTNPLIFFPSNSRIHRWLEMCFWNWKVKMLVTLTDECIELYWGMQQLPHLCMCLHVQNTNKHTHGNFDHPCPNTVCGMRVTCCLHVVNGFQIVCLCVCLCVGV